MGRQMTRTNDAFFVEQIQNINVTATDEQLVDFLYKLGSDASMIRVRDLELQPDPPHQKLNANIKLVASYQRNAPGNLKTTNAQRNHENDHARPDPVFNRPGPLGANAATVPLTPAQRQMRTRLRALTNNPAAAPAASPASPGAAAPQPGATTAPGATATAPVVPMTTPGVTAVSPVGAAATEQEEAGYTFTYDGVDVSQVLDSVCRSGGAHAVARAIATGVHRIEDAIAADQERGDRGVAGGAGAQRHHGRQHRRQVCESAAAGPGRGRAAGRWTAPMRPICRTSAPTSRTSSS